MLMVQRRPKKRELEVSVEIAELLQHRQDIRVALAQVEHNLASGALSFSEGARMLHFHELFTDAQHVCEKELKERYAEYQSLVGVRRYPRFVRPQ